MKEPKYCKQCGQKLSEGIFGLSPQYIEFEDGCYCQKCGRIKVDLARSKIKVWKEQ